MGICFINRRLVAWIACFAMLFGALAPSVSQAMSASRGEVWTEVCSVGGSKLIKIKGDPAEPQALHLEHCPFCATHADAFALPPGPSWSIPLPDAAPSHPPLFYRSPRPLTIWTTAQSRAPPSLA